MNPSSLVVWERVLESKFLLGLIIDGILKRVSKTVRTLVRRCPRKPWILQRLPSNGSMLCEEKKNNIFQALAALMASQQASAAKAGVSDLDGSVEKETGSKDETEGGVQR